MNSFRVRLNCIDHYQATPTRHDPQLRNDAQPSEILTGTKVPVVRIFGSTETGQKVCAHVHGVFPYLYVEYEGSLLQDEVGMFIYRLHLSIDHALAVSYRRDQKGDMAKFVARITLVKDLLQQGVIMKRKFQPYETHLQYLLQFMVDYNLYGCDYLDSSLTYFRGPVPSHNPNSAFSHLWHTSSIPTSFITDDPGLPRSSHCSLEVDICAHSIVNRLRVEERHLHHGFTEFSNPSVFQDVKLVTSMAGLWKDEARRRQQQQQRVAHTQHQEASLPLEGLVSMSADNRDSQPQVWTHEQDYRQKLHHLVADERTQTTSLELDFDTFVPQVPGEERIGTALLSVEDLHPSNLTPLLGLTSSTANMAQDPSSSIDVDEERVRKSYAENESFFNDTDENRLLPTAPKVFDSLKEKAPQRGLTEIMIPPLGTPSEVGKHYINMPGISASGFQTNSPPKVSTSLSLVEAVRRNNLGDKIGSNTFSQSSKPRIKRKSSRILLSAPQKRAKPMSIWSQRNANASSNSNKHGGNIDDKPRLEPITLGIPDNSSHRQRKSLTETGSSSVSTERLRSSYDDNGHFGGHRRVSFLPHPGPTALENIAPTESDCIQVTSGIFNSTELSKSSTSHRNTNLQYTADMWVFTTLPPSIMDVTLMNDHALPTVIYHNVIYGNEKDVPLYDREYAGKQFNIVGDTLPFLPRFDSSGKSPASYGVIHSTVSDRMLLEPEYQDCRLSCSWRSWEMAEPPPTFDVVRRWISLNDISSPTQIHARGLIPNFLSQIEGPSPRGKYDYKYTQRESSTSVQHEVQYMSTMSLEVHVNTRRSFVPNPEEDEVQCIFWSCRGDEAANEDIHGLSDVGDSGVLVLSPDGRLANKMRNIALYEIIPESSELDLMVRMVEIVRTHDPDILTGYEVHGSSWGYLIERARLKYDYDLCNEFSRMKSQSHGRFGKESDRWGFNTTSTIRVTGRHMINIWRAMRGELNLLQYTLENVVWHLLHRRIPHYSWKSLTNWHQSGRTRDLTRLLRYYSTRAKLNLDILDANELIPRTSEQARLLGVDFFSVFSRGSQFKVESIMFRIAKPENFILVSPSRKQVGGQNALECLPLVMEPQSAFYSSPLIVLDFQSLYPSVMIAYNYCYSTFLGRVTNWRDKSKMGFTEYKRQQGLLTLLKDYINIAPNGMMYARPEIRKSLLAKMLAEILETRIMVKSGMRSDKGDKTLQQLLNNRQLALKLLANVTYGYTSASFSGRMPCSEIADSIVQTGRETLEKATAYIHSVERWGAEVVYGDTDSLFVYLKGRSREEAFHIGQEMAQAITEKNPRPIKLKFEKVYHPCVLLAKKRYVGYKYESKEQKNPIFDAKGIETVRRDGTPAEQKIEEKSLRLLFETADLSKVKDYFQKQCEKIMRGKVSLQDFCFAREVRLGSYSERGPTPAGALISTRRMLQDARAEPQYGERISYVVIAGAPGARLIDRCVSPEELLNNPQWQLDADYYISKNLIPPLERIFNLVGANVRQWYDEMPKIRRAHRTEGVIDKKWTLEAYMKSTNCLVCKRRTSDTGSISLCLSCRANVPASMLTLLTKLSVTEHKYNDVVSICRNCEGRDPLETVECDSHDCPVFWTRTKYRIQLINETTAAEPVIRELTAAAPTLEW